MLLKYGCVVQEGLWGLRHGEGEQCAGLSQKAKVTMIYKERLRQEKKGGKCRQYTSTPKLPNSGAIIRYYGTPKARLAGDYKLHEQMLSFVGPGAGVENHVCQRHHRGSASK